MISEINEHLKNMCDKFGTDTVFPLKMRMYLNNRKSGLSLTQIMMSALYNNEKNSKSLSMNEMTGTILDFLNFRPVTENDEFKEATEKLIKLLRECFEGHEKISRITLEEKAHPFPEHKKELSFLVVVGSYSYVFIASV